MKTRRLPNTALLVTAALLALATGCSSGGSRPTPGALEETNLNVAVVPVEESAGFFIALYQGLFKAQGLNVHFEPAISSDTVIDQQAFRQDGSLGWRRIGQLSGQPRAQVAGDDAHRLHGD